jgi:acyl-ACP thioesterase
VSRRFASRRRISLSDTDAAGRLRLDAVARYLQDVASEDWLDAGFDHDSHVWVVRRTEVEMRERFRPEDALTIETWCSGAAGSTASRRYSIRGERGGAVEAESIWIHLDRGLRPKRLDERFLEVYGTSAAGRKASGRLALPAPAPGGAGRPWRFRTTDVDRLGHVNNAAYWAPLEDAWAGRLLDRFAAVLEYRRPIDIGEPVELVTSGELLWLVVGGETRSAARLDPDGPAETEQLA